MVLITGFYRVTLQTVLKSKIDAEKKKEKGEGYQKDLSLEELRKSNARKDEQIVKQDKQIQNLREELRTALTLLRDEDPGCVSGLGLGFRVRVTAVCE